MVNNCSSASHMPYAWGPSRGLCLRYNVLHCTERFISVVARLIHTRPMPTLDWIGKDAVVNHHQEVPFHLLREDESRAVGDPSADNLLMRSKPFGKHTSSTRTGRSPASMLRSLATSRVYHRDNAERLIPVRKAVSPFDSLMMFGANSPCCPVVMNGKYQIWSSGWTVIFPTKISVRRMLSPFSND